MRKARHGSARVGEPAWSSPVGTPCYATQKRGFSANCKTDFFGWWPGWIKFPVLAALRWREYRIVLYHAIEEADDRRWGAGGGAWDQQNSA
jgi:hypothetical protein